MSGSTYRVYICGKLFVVAVLLAFEHVLVICLPVVCMDAQPFSFIQLFFSAEFTLPHLHSFRTYPAKVPII